MSIRFSCTACGAVMKIGEAIAEPKKVRCTGCGLLILLTPDPADPFNVIASFPKKTEKPNTMSDAQRRLLLFGGMGVLLLILLGALWYTLRNNSP